MAKSFVAPRQPGASTAIIDRLSHSRVLRKRYASGTKGAAIPWPLALLEPLWERTKNDTPQFRSSWNQPVIPYICPQLLR